MRGDRGLILEWGRKREVDRLDPNLANRIKRTRSGKGQGRLLRFCAEQEDGKGGDEGAVNMFRRQ